jgi:hypothetical protein
MNINSCVESLILNILKLMYDFEAGLFKKYALS